MATTHIKKEKVLVPKLRFKEFEGEWSILTLGDTSEIVGGGTPETFNEAYWNGKHQWFTPTELKSKYVSESKRTITDLGLKKSSAKLLPKGTLLFSSRATVGDVSIALREVCTNQGFQSFIVNEDNNNEFIYNWIIKNKNLFLKRASGSTFLEISKKEILKLKTLIPSLPEQQKIASFLSAVDEKIQQLTKKKALLEQYKKGIMQHLFSGQLRFKDENGNPFPDWEFPNANLLFKSVSDKNHNSDLPILAITQDQGAIPRELIDYNMVVSEKSVASYKVVQVGDFIISLRSFQGGIEYSNYKGICSPAYNILRPTSEKVNKDFYKRYLKTEKYIRQLQSKLEGIRDGKMISFKYFSEIKLPFPCSEEQKKIATYLSSIDTKIESVKNQITQTQTFKKGLLQQMFV